MKMDMVGFFYPETTDTQTTDNVMRCAKELGFGVRTLHSERDRQSMIWIQDEGQPVQRFLEFALAMPEMGMPGFLETGHVQQTGHHITLFAETDFQLDYALEQFEKAGFDGMDVEWSNQ